MKILQIGKFFPPYLSGGIESTSYKLHQIMNESGVDMDFLGFLPKKYEDDVFENKVFLCKTNIYKFSTPISFSFIRKYREIKENYDIIYVNLPNPMANLAISLFPPKKAKIILCWHSDVIKQKFLLFFYRPLIINLLKKTTYVTAPTQIHLDESDFSMYFEGKKRVLPLLQNYPLKVNCFSSFESGGRKKVILGVGRLVYYKGFSTLLSAANEISDECEIHIAGDGPLREELEKFIKDNKLENKVKLLGRISDEELAKEYEKAFLFAFPSNSRAEMLGLVQYEAFSYAKPIVSCSIPRSGAITINKDGKTGYIVPINNPIAFAEKINILANNKDIYENFSRNVIEELNTFNNSEKIEAYMSCFKEVLQ